MIKHHPKFELLKAFVEGELSTSLSAGIAIHVDMCPACQQKIAELTEQAAEMNFEQDFLQNFIVDSGEQLNDVQALDFEEMIEGITESDDIDTRITEEAKVVEFKGLQYKLPKALTNMDIASPANIGKLSRSRIELGEGEVHSSLLHIEPGGSVPQHTHKGYELTVLLAGSFSDESGEYVKGDFILLDGKHTHQPISEKGCLCFTVANDALQFTQGINRLLNPIGSFIY